MSTPPRPWVLEEVGPDSPHDGQRYELRYRGDPDVMVAIGLIYDQRTSVVAPTERNPAETGQLIVTAVNAFDALLAVAKAAAKRHDFAMLLGGEDVQTVEEYNALRDLGAKHPGWRRWTA